MTTRPAALEETVAIGVPGSLGRTRRHLAETNQDPPVEWTRSRSCRSALHPEISRRTFFSLRQRRCTDRGPALAEMTATVVRTGTAKRASRQIEEDLRRIGADLSSSAGQDTSAIRFRRAL